MISPTFILTSETAPFIVGLVIGSSLAMIPLVFAEALRRRYRRNSRRSSNLAHQLKSPISIILGALDALRALAATENPDQKNICLYFEMLKKNITRLESFILKLRKVASIQDGDIPLSLSLVPAKDLVQESLEGLSILSQAKGLTISTDIRTKRLLSIDREKIKEVVLNLMMNAIAYSNEGTIHLLVEDKKYGVLFSISDQGRGLSHEQKRKIFNRFYRGGYTEGTGLGLAIAKGWVEAHNGTIGVTSPGINQGSCFWFVLPKNLGSDLQK